MRSSPFGTHRGRLARRVFIGVGALALGLIFAARAAGGETTPIGETGRANVFSDDRAPDVQPFVADPFLANRRAAENGRDRAQYSSSDQARYDAALAAAVRFAQAYASYDGARTPQSYVDGLPGLSAQLRPVLLTEAIARWPQYTQDRTLAVARLSGVPPVVMVFDKAKAEVRVQVLQDLTGAGGQRTNAPTYRIELTWMPAASASPNPSPSASPDPVVAQLGGFWLVVRIQAD
jgi:hypothetical protein